LTFSGLYRQGERDVLGSVPIAQEEMMQHSDHDEVTVHPFAVDEGTPILAGIHHVKLPVTDPERSRDWYQRVFGFTTELDFVEDGRLMGVAMIDPASQIRLAVRREPDRAQVLYGFDPIALAVATRAELEAWRRWLEQQKIAHQPVTQAHIGWIISGIHDPDGIEIRLYTLERPG
jgi:catechol 2,3-dioxygenase-like lactoylglutathione lyase family enzyme